MGKDRSIGWKVLAGLAEAENLMAVMHRPEGELTADGFLKRFQIRPVELNDGIAVQADEVVMMLIAAYSFIVRMLISEAALPDQAALHQQIQCAVDRGPADGLPLGLQGHVKLIRIKVMGLAKHLRHQIQPLSCEFQLPGAQESLKALLFLGPFDGGLSHESLGGQSTRFGAKRFFY
jgi:hypothetical protein